MVKMLEINQKEATTLLAVLSDGIDSLSIYRNDNPTKNRLITLKQKIELLFPEE